ncbi:MAG: GNAT family N-acetyltransferase [Acidobacteriota bacterium]
MQTIETARVYLRPFTSDDLDSFALIGSDPDVMRYIGDGKPQSRERTRTRFNAILDHHNRHGFGVWAAVDKTSGEWMGFCGLQFLDNASEIEVGYRLAKRFWGIGLASEAAKASLRYGFEALGLNRIVAVVQPGNIGSRRVLEKIGLRYVKDARFYNSDVKYYAMTREEYQRDDSTYIQRPAED